MAEYCDTLQSKEKRNRGPKACLNERAILRLLDHELLKNVTFYDLGKASLMVGLFLVVVRLHLISTAIASLILLYLPICNYRRDNLINSPVLTARSRQASSSPGPKGQWNQLCNLRRAVLYRHRQNSTASIMRAL